MKLPRGVLYMAASAFGFAAMAMLVKIASARLPTGEIVLARGVITLALSYAMLVRAGLPPPAPWGSQRGRLVLRGGLGFVGLSTYFAALAHLPVGEAVTLQQTVPLLTALLAWWLLGERIGASTLLAIGTGIAGVLLIVHPSGTGLDALGIALALASAVTSAFTYVTVRTLARTEHPLVIVFYFPLVATPLSIPWAMASWVTPGAVDLLLLFALSLATQVGQVFMTLALSIERVGRAMSVGYLQIVFAMLLQLAVFGEVPAVATLAGAALIIGGTLAVSRSRDEPRPQGRGATP